jgi:hypothetical protein
MEIIKEEKGKRAKMLDFQPLMDYKNKSVQKTFESKFGTFYYFVVSFDNGDIGECKSSKNNPSWKKGFEYTYNLTQKKITDTFNINEIEGLKLCENESRQYGGNYQTKSAEDWKGHAMQTSISLSTQLIKEQLIEPATLDGCIKKMYSWIEFRVQGNDKLYWQAFSVLQSAVNTCIGQHDMSILLKEADRYFVMCNEIKQTNDEQAKAVEQKGPTGNSNSNNNMDNNPPVNKTNNVVVPEPPQEQTYNLFDDDEALPF